MLRHHFLLKDLRWTARVACGLVATAKRLLQTTSSLSTSSQFRQVLVPATLRLALVFQSSLRAFRSLRAPLLVASVVLYRHRCLPFRRIKHLLSPTHPLPAQPHSIPARCSRDRVCFERSRLQRATYLNRYSCRQRQLSIQSTCLQVLR
jgi:hypothetical protein